MTQPQSDPLEDRMRHALQDDGWKLPADDNMLDRVHTGARRRRRRHQAGMALAAVAVVAGGVGAAGYATNFGGPEQNTTASQDSGNKSAEQQSKATDLRASSSATQETAKASRPSSTPNVPPAKDTEQPRSENNPQQLKPVPSDFRPASLTATSTTKFWVLGAAGDNASVALTDNGGKSFGQVGAFNARVANDQNTSDSTVHDVRFADNFNGWAYGNALWSTNDGGQTWAQTTSVPGEVVRLEADNGRAYALAKSDDAWSVWTTPAGSTGWQRLDVALSNPSDLAATNSVVAIADRTSEETYTMVSDDSGGSFAKRPTPCAPDLSAGDLSASQGSLWLQCPTGTGSTVVVSDDAGREWKNVDTGGDAVSSTASAVGARSPNGAVVAMPGEVRKVNGGEADTVQVEGLDTPTYSGFTTPEVGYIIDLQGNVFRTIDAGSEWNKLSVD